METPKKNNNAAVDNILEELKTSGAAPAADGSLDDILAEMGLGKGPAVQPKRAVSVQKPAAAAPQSAGPQGTAVFEAVGKEKPAAPQGGETAVFTPVKAQKEGELPLRASQSATRTLPAFDIGEDTGPIGPRVGKAAAIDRVDHDKFAGDEELLSWFSPEADSKFSRRAMRKAEKERMKQEAADEKERRRSEKERLRREKKGLPAEEEDELWADYPIEPLVREKPVPAAEPPEPEEDIPAPAVPAPVREPAPLARFQSVAELRPEPRPPAGEAPPAAPRQPAPPKQDAQPPAVKTPTPGRGPVTAILEDLGVERGDGQRPANVPPVTKPPVAEKPPAPQAAKPPVQEIPRQPTQATPPPPAKKTGKGPVTAVLEELGVETATRGPVPGVVKPPVAAPQAPISAQAAPGVATPGKVKGPITAVLEELGLEGDGKAAPTMPQPPAAARAAVPKSPAAAPKPPVPPAEADDGFVEGSTIEINIAKVAEARRQAAAAAPRTENGERVDTQTYALEEEHDGRRVPSAAFTQEFPEEGGAPAPKVEKSKNLFLDDMVDERFHDFFSETVIVERDEVEKSRSMKLRRKPKKSHTALITGEFARLAEQAEAEEDEEFEDYNRPQDAEAIERDILTLRGNLLRRTIISGVLGVLLIWLGLGFAEILPLPAFLVPADNPLLFSIVYLILLIAAVVVNFTTIATGLVGLVGEPTVDSPPALAAVAALLQGVVMMVQLVGGQPAVGTLFAGIAVLVLAFNCLGKWLRSTAILENFRVASAGFDHSAAYVLDGGHEVAYNITSGLEEENPSILISRPTALVKGFLRKSFSQRWSDRLGRILGWVILAVAILVGVFCYVQTKDLMQAISALVATFCIAAPFSSTLLAAVPSRLLQMGTTKVGAVVPGWSAIEELGSVNVVQASAQDIFPPGSVHLKGIKTFEKERVDLAILYAASVLVESCATLREVFLAVIQGKNEMLFKVENLLEEPGRGFSAWVENNRVVIGTREMLQKHGIDPPPVELEMKFVKGDHLPVYLAVSGKLFAMFIVGYTPDPEVQDTLDGLIKSGVSLLVTSEDMNVTGELIEKVYQLPSGALKVLGKRELDLLEPLQAYLPESEGAMTHMGSFASFIGGMRAAAGCAAAEKMSGIVQAASVGLGCVLAFLLAYNGGLATLGMGIAILYQLGWSVLVSALPFAKRY